MKLCDIVGHKYRPFEYKWAEFLPNSRHTPYNREGAYRLAYVYCMRCGKLTWVKQEGDRVYYDN